MSDRYKGLIITLEKDFKDEDAKEIMTAIAMVKGVLKVSPSVANVDDHLNRMRIKHEIEGRIWNALRPDLA